MSTEPAIPSASEDRAAFRWDAADAYLFDIDGTLLNSHDGVHYNAFQNAVKHFFGVPPNFDRVPLHGNTDPGIIRAVLRQSGIDEADIDAKLAPMMRAMCVEVEQNAAGMRPEVCPSIEDLIQRLQSAGKLLAVASGNLEPIAWKKLEASGLRRFFAFGSFSDQRELRSDIIRWGVEQARRRLSPDATVYVVGDTPADIVAARTVGVPVIAVATGIFSLEQLNGHAPDLCISCCTELLEQNCH